MTTEAPVPRPRFTLPELAAMKPRGERFVMVTAYDAPGARLADEVGIELILVGDSAAMVVLGHDSTVPATVDEMVVLTRAARRGAQRALLVADMPFGSFQVSDAEAITNAVRFVKESDADAVKLEGGGASLSRVRSIVGAGISVMGHIGLTPQSATMLGGYKAQGRTAAKARSLLADAQALQDAGCFAIVLEAVPAPVATRISQALRIPTIGIGAGPGCDGQVLVWHDLLGLTEGRAPRFVKRYAHLAQDIRTALAAYSADVRSGAFPTEEHSYGIPEEELALFESELDSGVLVRAEDARGSGSDWL
jgi:3-methyl-2-oxobutanoate hydroxymethyltransferase